MKTLELITTSGYFLFILLSSLSLGSMFVKPKRWRLYHIGLSIALGLGLFGYVSLVLGLLSIFNKLFLVLSLLAVLILGINRKKLWYFIDLIKREARAFKGKYLELIAILVFFFMLGTSYLGAMQPPHTSDELNYHFPEAQKIVDTQTINFKFGDHYFYGSIPKQMEILYASAISINGYALAHLVHFAFMLSFLLILYGILKDLYGLKAASLSVFFVMLYDDFVWNSISGFVDGATVSMEIGALLFIAGWIIQKKRSFIKYAGILLGVGMSIKYSVAITSVYLLLVLLLLKRKELRALIVPAVILGGYWYAKNLFLYNNPFYPLYFGHQGVDEETYRRLIEVIQQFRPKTIDSFIKLMGYFREIPRIPVLAAVILSPISLIVKKNQRFVLLLFTYGAAYTLYWFFLGTHQMRFFMPVAMVSLILLSILASSIRNRWLILTVLVTYIYATRAPYFHGKSVWEFFWDTKFRVTERQYALGNITKDELMYRQYGCQYSSVLHLNSLEDSGDVLDLWSPQVDFNVGFYLRGKDFKTIMLDDSLTDEQVLDRLKEQDIKYMYVRESTREEFLRRSEDYFRRNEKSFLKVEEVFLDNSSSINNIDDCSIYKLSQN